MEKYNIIYADPPWKYKENWGNGAVKHHYGTMTFKDIKNLNVQGLAKDNCHLYLWVTNPFLKEGLELMKLWGFEYKQTITWVKTYKTGEPIMGLGYYTRVCTEHCLFGIRGRLPRLTKSEKNIIFSNQMKHSEKPREFRSKIIRLSGDLPRIELFARDKVDGWDSWGNEIESDIKLISSKACPTEEN